MPQTIDSNTDENLSELLQSAGRQASKWRKFRRWTLGLSASLLLIPLLTSYFLKSEASTLGAYLMFFPIVLSMLGLLAGILIRPMRGNPLHSLWASESVQAIGPLAEAAQMLMPDVSAKALAALLRALPRVNESDIPALTSYQRVCLHRLLGETAPSVVSATMKPLLGLTGLPTGLLQIGRLFVAGALPPQPPLMEAILYAYIYMGDASDLRVVQRLANAVPTPAQTVIQANLQKTARDILPLLAERVEQLQSRADLLRASSESALPMQAETLLRPAQASGTTAPDELLRISAEPADEPASAIAARYPDAVETANPVAPPLQQT